MQRSLLPLGSEFLPSTIDFHTVTVPADRFEYSTGLATIANTSSLGGASVLVGRASDGTIAHGLLAITTLSDRLANISASNIVAVRLRLQALNYRYPNSDARMATFDVVSVDGTLNENTQWNADLVSSIESSPTLGSYDEAYPDTSRISVSLDPQLTADFLNNYATAVDDSGATRIDVHRYLALRARPDANAIGSWLGVNFLGAEDSVQPVLEVQLADTTVSLPVEVTDWIASLPDTAAPGRMLVAGGAPIRSWIHFPLDSIPSDAVIHRAELMIDADPAMSTTGTSDVTNYMAVYVASDSTRARNEFSFDGSVPMLSAYRAAADSSTFSSEFSVSNLAPTITTWLRARSGRISGSANANNGLILALNRNASARAPLETGTVDRLYLHAPTSEDAAMRPRLSITYSIQTDAK